MPDVMPSPPEVADLDEKIRALEDKKADYLFSTRVATIALVVALLVLAFSIVAYNLWGGGWSALLAVSILGGFVGTVGGGSYISANRNERLEVIRELHRLQISRSDVLAGRAKRSAAPYARYKEHLPALAGHYKVRAQRYRRGYVTLQLVIIVGSLSASAVTALAESEVMRIASVLVSLVVAIAASSLLTFRLRERGEALQKTATDIEREYRAAELQIGDYVDEADERTRFRRLVERVEALRDEQAVQERDLGQSPDLQQSTTSGIGTV